MMLRTMMDRKFFVAVVAAVGLAAGWAVADIVIDGNRTTPDVSVTSPCAALPVHTPKDDVAFRPTAGTRPVDLGDPSPITAPSVIDIPLTIDFVRRLGINLAQGVQLEGTLGFLRIGADGSATYDGKDITQKLHDACGQHPSAAPAPSDPTNPQIPSDDARNDTERSKK